MSTPKAKSTASARRAAENRVEQELVSACWGQPGDDDEVIGRHKGDPITMFSARALRPGE
jgi:hypothetical protein